MKRIIALLKPFVIDQTLYVYDEGNKLETVSVKIDDLPETIIDLAIKHNLEQVDLTGPTAYAKGIIKQIREKEINKYNENTLILKHI